MVCGFESRPAHQQLESSESPKTSWPSNVETLDKLERRITLTLPADDINVRSRVAPEALVAHRQGRRLPSRQGADERRGPALRLLGALRSHERQGRPGLRRGRQRSQAARRRPAAHHREGRGARRRAGLRRHLRGLSRSQDRRPGQRRSRARHDRSRPTPRSTRRRHPAQAAPHLRAAPAAERRRRTATA